MLCKNPDVLSIEEYTVLGKVKGIKPKQLKGFFNCQIWRFE